MNRGLPPLLVVCVVHFWATFFLMPQTRTSLDTPELFFGDFLLLSRAEHNQNPPTGPANRHCVLISTRRKIAVSPASPPELRALAGGRSFSSHHPTIDTTTQARAAPGVEEIQRKSRVREWAPHNAPRIRTGVTKKDQKAK